MKIFLILSLFLLATNILYAKKSEKLVWPHKPDQARIEFVSSIKNPDDLGIKKGFFAKLGDFFFGEEKVYLSAPFGIHVSGDRVFTGDISSKKVYVFDRKENEVIWLEGSKNERFLYPVDIVTDDKSNIYVSDSVQAKIYVFEKDGDFKYIIENKKIKRPVGIAINQKDKKLYVVDALSSQIHVMSLEGKLLSSIGQHGNGEVGFNRPTYIDIGANGNLYISDSMNHRIVILDKDGTYLHSFGQLGQKVGSFSNPRGISLDSDENIYVSDTLFNTIQIFNKKGEFLMLFGNYGPRDGEFALPIDIDISKNNEIYISDTNNRRFQIFKRLNISKTGGL